MKSKALYSRAQRQRGAGTSIWIGDPYQAQSRAAPRDEREFDDGPSLGSIVWGALQRFYRRYERSLLVAASVLISIAAMEGYVLLHPAPHALTQNDIDGAVQYTLAHTPRTPAETARAATIIAPSVVEVEGYLSAEHAAELAKRAAKTAASNHAASPHDKQAPSSAPPALPDKPLASSPDQPEPDAIGSGVVVDESGKILTALHVISSTDRWVVVFDDGSMSDADLVGSQPENDLAVLQPRHKPDELQPAALASTDGLTPGDQVVASGFPFGIGPSVTAGVVSGLGREFVDPDNNHIKLSNLIQFDAAVNPGNSGGPLVNRDGEVLGIVTAIVNPSGARVFAGIGFAVPIENAMRAVGENPL